MSESEKEKYKEYLKNGEIPGFGERYFNYKLISIFCILLLNLNTFKLDLKKLTWLVI